MVKRMAEIDALKPNVGFSNPAAAVNKKVK
jgi:hypothetical protein